LNESIATILYHIAKSESGNLSDSLLFQKTITRVLREKLPGFVIKGLSELLLKIKPTDKLDDLNKQLLSILTPIVGVKNLSGNQQQGKHVLAIDYEPTDSSYLSHVMHPEASHSQTSQNQSQKKGNWNKGNKGKGKGGGNGGKSGNSNAGKDGIKVNALETLLQQTVMQLQQQPQQPQSKALTFSTQGQASSKGGQPANEWRGKTSGYVQPWPKDREYKTPAGTLTKGINAHFQGHCIKCGSSKHSTVQCTKYKDDAVTLSLCDTCRAGFHSSCKAFKRTFKNQGKNVSSVLVSASDFRADLQKEVNHCFNEAMLNLTVPR
jgi:hypothetical protein